VLPDRDKAQKAFAYSDDQNARLRGHCARYSRTALGAMSSSRPIARVLAPVPKCIVSN
jgi:hypothetical protein